MASTGFDTLNAAEELAAAGIEERHARAIAAAIRDGQGDIATKADLVAAVAELRADLYRALWFQAAGIIAVLAALAGMAFGLAGLIGGA